DRRRSGLVGLIRQPPPIRRERRVGRLPRRTDGGKRPTRSILSPIGPQSRFGALRLREQKVALRRPRLRNVSGAFFRGRETFGRARAVGALRKDREIAVAVRLEGQALTVRRPRRHAVAAPERQPT